MAIMEMLEPTKEDIIIHPIVWSALIYEGLAAIYYIHLTDDGKILRVTHPRDGTTPARIRELTRDDTPEGILKIYDIIFKPKDNAETKSELDNTGSVEPEKI